VITRLHAALAIGLALAAIGSPRARQLPVPADPLLNIPEQPPSPPISSALTHYPAVTAERLKKPADGEWLMTRRTYDGWGYSPLDQINAQNVKHLQTVWTMSTTRVSTPGSVSGRTPWPRLKM